jgi:methylenetetrahydrofolate dehydrogenase (NADP+)/methenyltetrahydrofolate cyclohydrolase
MKIDGKLIAQEIKQKLGKQVISLKSKNIIPHLAVILIGHDPSSQVYVRQKIKVGQEIGVKVTLIRKQITDNKKQIINLVNKLNQNPSVHGIIIQRPVPIDISKEELDLLVDPQKDVDGFYPKSPFTPPVAAAVLKILEWVYNNLTMKQFNNETIGNKYYAKEKVENFNKWLTKQKIIVIGRGETAGRPIAESLNKMNVPFFVAHSQTKNIKELCLSSDIIITCVGRPNIVRPNMITNKTILIGVGLHLENDKLQTDYDQEDIAGHAAYYTPVPGGVGPVNVACLFDNLLSATMLPK